ncbi:MAG: hypothetical protein Q8Q89_00660 [bacterium]|nr:hypothetical protein [bacterium]
MGESSQQKTNLFGFGVITYGLASLLTRHPKDFVALLGHIFSDYFIEQYKSVSRVRYIDSDLENKITPQSGAVISYFSFIPFLVGSLGFLKLKFGNKTDQDVHSFLNDLKSFFSDARFIFENAPTKLQYRPSPSLALKALHFIDRPRNCFPSLHVILTSYSYLKTNELIKKYSSDDGTNSVAKNFLFNWSLRIIESCLLTKQHGLRDIAGALAIVSSKCPQFSGQDTNEIINLIFSHQPKGLSSNSVDLVRKEIELIYSELVTSIENQQGDYRSVLVNYARMV